VSKRPGREQNWYPVSQLSWFTGHIREGIAVTGRQLELLQPARARPCVLDDATVARIIRVHRDQAADLTLFQNQAGRWKADPGLTTAQRDAAAGFEAAIGQLRQLNSEVLAVAEELSHGTIETVPQNPAWNWASRRWRAGCRTPDPSARTDRKSAPATCEATLEGPAGPSLRGSQRSDAGIPMPG
jgi:hypothetical protein